MDGVRFKWKAAGGGAEGADLHGHPCTLRSLHTEMVFHPYYETERFHYQLLRLTDPPRISCSFLLTRFLCSDLG